MRQFILSAVLALMPAAHVRAAVIFNLATGFDHSTNSLLPNGSTDSKYSIAPGGTGGHYGASPFVLATPVPTGWLPDNVSMASRWVVLAGSGAQGINVDGGTYFLQTTFNLDADVNLATVSIENLRYAADNKLVNVAINGASVFQQAQTFGEEFNAFHDIGDVGLGLFVTGQNTIRFDMFNQLAAPNPLGLRIEGAVVGVPEPAGLLRIASVLNIAWLLIRRKSLTCRDR